MPSLLRDNLPYKLVALVFAVLLHVYVAGQQNPVRMVTVPLTLRNLPPGLLPGADAPHDVTLSLSGPDDALTRAADVVASVDLGRARAGRGFVAPVEVKAPDGLAATATPDTVVLTLQAKQKRRLPVTVAAPGPALPGYRFLPPRVTPQYVTASGGADAVGAITQLVVKMDTPAATLGTVDDDFDIVALDAQGSQVEGVTLTPSHAHVSVRMVHAPVLKNVLVSADIMGALPPTSRVDSIEVRPLTVVVTGRPDRLGQIDAISTAPIDLTGATGDITRTVNCVAPPGVTLTGASAVIVTIHISLGNAPTSVPVPPANPAPPTGAIPNAVSPNGVLPNGMTQGH